MFDPVTNDIEVEWFSIEPGWPTIRDTRRHTLSYVRSYTEPACLNCSQGLAAHDKQTGKCLFGAGEWR